MARVSVRYSGARMVGTCVLCLCGCVVLVVENRDGNKGLARSARLPLLAG